MMRQAGFTVLIGHGDHVRGNTPYHTWQGIYRHLLDDEGKMPPELKKEIGEDLAPLLNSVLGVSLDETPKTREMSPQMRSENTHLLLVKLLKKIAPPGTLIVLENAHW
jgi:hypothetical protein